MNQRILKNDTILLIQKNMSLEIKKLGGGNCRTANIIYAARCKIHGDIYIGNTEEKLGERCRKHRYDAKNTYINTNTTLTRILKF